ncbi:hypothetical protein [Roseomonas harenae]|uniref:hypothetical protein n=1 Tax=Muricoccus harenae TaxID=2692566 RepID=UPI001331A9E6|nr:hypothetical protein [Roseomonas harenae]
MMLYASGTIGRAKGVRRLPGTPEQNDSARRIRSYAGGARQGMRTAIMGPPYHAGPASSARAAPSLSEVIVVVPRFDAEELLRAIEEYQLTQLW